MFTLIIILVLSFLYVEWIWSLVETGQKSFEVASRMLKSMAGINYIFAVWFSAWGCLVYAAICSFYQMVIFKERIKNLSGPVA